ncbi:MAG: methionine--tRNA ligase [Candidatus Niyogibacteria bacterium CG10_big_fil_rev_8_21_14_0_10_46_36]|uniref:methionine--tRNA ligase n=1 Tax=Candidatus Niyogibacteria bacterium CG10_big_fil_rev_8_21_14_0_10_46_36 TaxID=1974726 RepID=A0A2H0TEK3_9BACT|nr:MAG: methionine--tRNA ligase [Candidatus Niyogibacteria bacterium CG10_big_fil_rev_8_21_14_0_10_46_36]
MEKFYVTTSLPYVNAPPHIGFALEAVQTDVIARWRRIKGDDVFFLSGTDEHGAKIARSAEKEGKTPQELVDANAATFKKLLEELFISHTDFIRTSDTKRHWPGAQVLWKKIEAKGDLYKATYKGLYCVGHEAFITEKDLIDGKCVDHNQKPELLEEENYYFKLSRYSKKIKELIAKGELTVFPESRKNEIMALLDDGLQDISFSRPAKDIPWGVPVPGDDTQTMYVWCDALSNYISALGFGSEDDAHFQKYWPANLHVIGKDILRFHAAIWTGMLLSAGLSLPKAIFVHGFITSGGKKMSKTIGNVIDPFDIMRRFSADALRYFLLREIEPFEDGDFTEERFVDAYNANLANGLGNYVSRVAKMITQYFGEDFKKPEGALLDAVPLQESSELLRQHKVNGGNIETFSVPFSFEQYIRPQYQEALDAYQFSRALDIAWGFLGELDRFIQHYEPFKLIKTDAEKTRAVLWHTVYGALAFADMVRPFLPATSEKIFAIFGAAPEDYKTRDVFRVTMGEGLFPRK